MAISAQSELMIQRAELIIIRIKGAALNQRMLEIPGNITHNTGINRENDDACYMFRS